MDPIDFYQRYWVLWNEMIEDSKRPILRYKVEEIDEDLILRMTERIWGVDPNVPMEDIGMVPRDYNTRRVSRASDALITWDNLSPEVRQLGQKYGYDPEP
jgi:hypothetical protein